MGIHADFYSQQIVFNCNKDPLLLLKTEVSELIAICCTSESWILSTREMLTNDELGRASYFLLAKRKRRKSSSPSVDSLLLRFLDLS